MKILALFAMEEELEGLAKLYKTTKVNGSGKIINENELEIHCVLTGIGKVNAACAATNYINKIDPKYVFSVGVAGGFGEGIEIKDVILCEKSTYTDVDLTMFDYSLGQVPKMPQYYNVDKELLKIAKKIKIEKIEIKNGIIGGQDSFANDKSVEKIFEQLKVNTIDMESTSIAQVCHILDKPFLPIRAISDLVFQENQINDYEKTKNEAIFNASIFAKKVIEKL